jgi:hypothetical protein
MARLANSAAEASLICLNARVVSTIGGIAVATPAASPSGTPSGAAKTGGVRARIRPRDRTCHTHARGYRRSIPTSVAGRKASADGDRLAVGRCGRRGNRQGPRRKPVRGEAGALRSFGPADRTGPGKTGTPTPHEHAVNALAATLGVSHAHATDVLRTLDRLSYPGYGVDPNGARFASLAASLGKTPAQLAQLLDTWKRGLPIEPPSPSPAAPSPSPSKSGSH